MSSYYANNGSFRTVKPAEDVDPMSSLSNVGDVMLVFACGLMVALVVAWNVDLSKFTQVQMGEELDQSQVSQATDQLNGDGNSYIEKGTVYQDPETGKYYLVEDTSKNGSSGNGNGASGQ